MLCEQAEGTLDTWTDFLASHLLAGDPGKASNPSELPGAPQLDGISRPQWVRNKAQEAGGHPSLLPCVLSGYVLCWGISPRKAGVLDKHSFHPTSQSPFGPVHDRINVNTI